MNRYIIITLKIIIGYTLISTQLLGLYTAYKLIMEDATFSWSINTTESVFIPNKK